MSEEDNVGDRYASPMYLANYLAMEWGDLLFPKGHSLLGPADPRENLDQKRVGRERVDTVRSFYSAGTFYKEVAEQIACWCADHLTEPPQKICDIGGSTGRLIYELNLRLASQPNAQPLEFLLVEQSATFCHWARRLLRRDAESDWGVLRGDSEREWWIPLPRYPEQAHFERVDAADVRHRLSVLKDVTICCADGEHTPRPDAYFDLVIALNVIDRHPEPKSFVRKIARLVRPGGLIVLASPFDFNVRFTPSKNCWVHDLQDLLPAEWSDVLRGEIVYSHRHHRWHYPTYICQLLGATAPEPGKRRAGRQPRDAKAGRVI
jgi:SAM-dependent methyltransferase